MTLAELVLAVHDITNRPDLPTVALSGIRSATIAAHTSEDYPKDIVEKALSMPTTDFVHSLMYLERFPRFRRFAYIRNYADGVPGDHIRSISPFATKDGYGLERTNVYYLAGDTVQLRTSQETNQFLIGAYVIPDVTEAGYDSWIAREYPFAIIHSAAAFVLRRIGFAEEAAYQMREAQAQMQSLITNIFEGQDYVR